MPIERTPSNLYAGEAVVFDAMPYVRFAEQIKARKEAKDMAIDQYFQKLPLGINSAGLRVNDVEGYVKRSDKTRKYWQQNRETIKNPRLDNGKTQTEYGQLIEDQKLYVQSSKGEEEKKKPIVALMADPNKRNRIKVRMFNDLHLHDLPLDDDNRKSLDFTQDYFSPNPYDPVKYFKSFAEKPTEIVDSRPDPKNPLNKIQTTTFTFTPQDIKSIERKAVDLYRNDDSFAEYVETELSKPSEYMALNDQFKTYIGRDIDPTKPEEVAIAYTLTGKQLEWQKEKLITDIDAKDRRDFAQAKELQASSNRNAINRLYTASGLRKSNENDEDILTMDAVLHNVSDIINEGEKENKMANFFGGGNIPIGDPNLLKTFSGIKKIGSTPVPPNRITFDKSKDQFLLEYDDDKSVIPVSSRDYIRLKIQEMNPNKDKGALNVIADKIISANGGLYNTIKKYSQPAPTDKYNKYEVK